MARPPISSCLKRVRCPVHGFVSPKTQRRHLSGITPAEVKALLPTMKDSVVWKWDQVTMAMSGGVDSAVALRILSEWPIDLNVIFMRNWDSLLSETPSEDPSQTSYAYSSDPSSSKIPNMSPCGWQKDWEAVQKVCAHVGIPESRVRLVDLSQEYWTRVFEPAINVWQEGGTPNPDVACNREIKFGALLEHVPVTNRSFLATGHYARVKRAPHATRLCRAEDMTKDQSYYLSAITEAQLRRALFPLAGIKKEDTRRLARYYGLPNAEKEESMGLCFVGERGKFGNFVSQYVAKPTEQGYLVDQEGKRLAPHNGLWHYTIGQRARIGGQLEPMFVAKKCIGESKQDIMVVPGGDHPALMCTRLHTHDFHWIAGKVPKGMVPGGTKRATVQLRHRMDPVPAVISHDWNGGGLTIDLLEPVQGVAIGQVCAVYYLDWCIGSGIIKQTWTADTHRLKRFRAIKEAKGRPEGYFGAEESGRLDVEAEEMEEDVGEGGQRVELPQPVTVYAADAEEESDSHAVLQQPVTASDFWDSAETAATPRPSQYANADQDTSTQQLPRVELTFGHYPVSRTPLAKGFGAPRGYAPWTVFGAITKELRRQDHEMPVYGSAREAGLSQERRVGVRNEARPTASGGALRHHGETGHFGSPATSDRPSKPRTLPRGSAVESGEKRSAPRGFGLARPKSALEDRPLAYEGRESDRPERGESVNRPVRTRSDSQPSEGPSWEQRGRRNRGQQMFGAEEEGPDTRRSRARAEPHYASRPQRISGFGISRSA